MVNTTGFFKCLGDETRLNIVKTLLKGEKPVLSIVEAVKKSQPNVSINLKLMKSEDILKSKRDGNTIYYSLKDRRKIQRLLNLVEKDGI